MSFGADTRAASIPITHAMTIAITALLMASLLVGAGTFLDNQQETVARAQLGDVAGDVAGQLNTLDRINANNSTETVRMHPRYERLAGGSPYTIGLITNGGGTSMEGALFVNSTALDLSIRLPLETETAMRPNQVRGQNPTLALCADGGDQYITVGECR